MNLYDFVTWHRTEFKLGTHMDSRNMPAEVKISIKTFSFLLDYCLRPSLCSGAQFLLASMLSYFIEA